MEREKKYNIVHERQNEAQYTNRAKTASYYGITVKKSCRNNTISTFNDVHFDAHQFKYNSMGGVFHVHVFQTRGRSDENDSSLRAEMQCTNVVSRIWKQEFEKSVQITQIVFVRLKYLLRITLNCAKKKFPLIIQWSRNGPVDVPLDTHKHIQLNIGSLFVLQPVC